MTDCPLEEMTENQTESVLTKRMNCGLIATVPYNRGK
jgi:hypothetical protein